MSETERQEFGAVEIERRSEVGTSALAAHAQARVQAAFIMAERRPRDLNKARERILSACKRPSFADAAIYHKPIGEGIEGPSIRLAEECMRQMGNLDVDVTTVQDDARVRILSVVVTDLEANLTHRASVTIDKTVERSDPKGRDVLGERTNSKGRKTFVVAATEDELLNKQNALVSKAMRTAGLRHVPADILEDAMAEAKATQEAVALENLPAKRERMIAGFARLNPPVTAAQLSTYLGGDVATADARAVVKLSNLGIAIRDGETTWAAAMEEKSAKMAQVLERVVAPPPAPEPAKKPETTAKEAAASDRERVRRHQPGANPPVVTWESAIKAIREAPTAEDARIAAAKAKELAEGAQDEKDVAEALAARLKEVGS